MSMFRDCYSQRSQLVSLLCPCSETATAKGASWSVYCVHVQRLLQPKEPAGQFTVSMFRDCYSQRSQLVSLLCPCSETATAKGASWSVYCVHVQRLLQPKEPAGQFTVSMFRDCYSQRSQLVSLLCPCSETATAKGASWSVYCVHVQGLFQRS